jgi:hypothetical protein
MISRALFLACFVFACDAYEPGIEVDIATTAIVGEASAHGFVTFRDSEGGGIEASHLHLAIASIELVECPSTLARAASALEALFISTAYAHTTGTPLHLGIPHIIDAARTSSVEERIGTLEPPPGRYCAIEIAFGPADADAVGLDSSTEGSAVGRTMVMRGLDWHEGQPVPLELESRVRWEIEVPLADETGGPAVLELDANARHATISYALETSPILEGYSPDDAPEQKAHAILQSVARSIRAIVRP